LRAALSIVRGSPRSLAAPQAITRTARSNSIFPNGRSRLEEAARRYDPAFASFTTLPAPTGLPNGVAEILERHSCVYEGRRFAHVVFRYSGHIVSLLVTEGSESIGPSPELLPADGALQVASFSAGRHLAFVVSDLSSQDTSRFAQAIVGLVSRRLANG
jgi:hypothetical protein